MTNMPSRQPHDTLSPSWNTTGVCRIFVTAGCCRHLHGTPHLCIDVVGMKP